MNTCDIGIHFRGLECAMSNAFCTIELTTSTLVGLVGICLVIWNCRCATEVSGHSVLILPSGGYCSFRWWLIARGWWLYGLEC